MSGGNLPKLSVSIWPKFFDTTDESMSASFHCRQWSSSLNDYELNPINSRCFREVGLS